MNWQEYQDAVGELYIQMEGVGRVFKNITRPDKITGQARQIDTWVEMDVKDHKIGILVDAKFRKVKIDVKDVEEVFSLGNAVGANLCVLVALNGWTRPAAIKAKFIGLDLKLYTLEEALTTFVPHMWFMCPFCEHDCIVVDTSGGMVVDDMLSLLLAGRCRECRGGKFHCHACGESGLLKLQKQEKCGCGHTWKNFDKSIMVKAYGEESWIEVTRNTIMIDPEAANLHITEGLNYKENGDFLTAINEFTKAIEIIPFSATPYYHRAITYDEDNQLDKAIADYTVCLDINPEYAMGYGSRGIAYYASKRFAEAISDFEYYLRLDPNSPNHIMIRNALAQAKLNIQ